MPILANGVVKDDASLYHPAVMKTTLKNALALVLMLCMQLQPLQVHARVLAAEQAGHTPGQLSHSHHAGAISTVQDGVSDVMTTDDHQTECHPAHVLFATEHSTPPPDRMQAVRYRRFAPDFESIDLALDLPPPRQSSL